MPGKLWRPPMRGRPHTGPVRCLLRQNHLIDIDTSIIVNIKVRGDTHDKQFPCKAGD